MSVPKCKECEFHRYESGDAFYYCKERNWCNESTVKYNGIGKFILANKVKTSPKWCPLREIQKEGEK